MIGDTKRSRPIVPIQIILTRFKRHVISIIDLNSACNQMSQDKRLQQLTNFAIAGQQEIKISLPKRNWSSILIFYGQYTHL